jgi:uncharacterized lipoprotein YmbA
MTSRPLVRLGCSVARSALALALAVALSGCSFSRPAPVKNTFMLDPTLPSPAAAAKPATLRIGAVNVAAPYRDRSFVYRTGELQFESDFYHEFFVAPASMLSQATGRALDSAKVFARVVPAGSAPEEGDYVLEAFVSDLYADARRNPAGAVLGATFYLTRTSFPSSVVWSRGYLERVALKDSSAESLAQAWNEALSRMLEALASDLAALDVRAP